MSMKRGRKPRLESYVDVHLTLAPRVAAALDKALHDPLTGKPAYGARSKLIVQLLYDWLKEQGALPPECSTEELDNDPEIFA